MERIVFQLGEEDAVTAADDGAVVGLIRKPKPRRKVIQLGPPRAREPWVDLHPFAVRAAIHVPANTKIRGQAITQLPVVLEPRGVYLSLQRIREIADRDGEVTNERRQSVDIPRGRV